VCARIAAPPRSRSSPCSGARAHLPESERGFARYSDFIHEAVEYWDAPRAHWVLVDPDVSAQAQSRWIAAHGGLATGALAPAMALGLPQPARGTHQRCHSGSTGRKGPSLFPKSGRPFPGGHSPGRKLTRRPGCAPASSKFTRAPFDDTRYHPAPVANPTRSCGCRHSSPSLQRTEQTPRQRISDREAPVSRDCSPDSARLQCGRATLARAPAHAWSGQRFEPGRL
jgi:hypothetical protein